MNYCTNCGHELGVGRYCTNCGLPVDSAGEPDWRTDTAERSPIPPPPSTPAPTTPPPSTPPPAPAGSAEPGPPRFPLFADEVTPTTTQVPSAEPELAPEPTDHRRPTRWPLWLGVAAVLLLFVVVGVKLLSSDDEPTQASDEPSSDSSGSPGKKPGPGKKPSDEAPPAAPGDVTADATVDVPATAPSGVDTAGNPVDYDAANMLDGVPETTWRMAGDGSGKELTITLPGETELRSVGLINGYAKAASGPKGNKIDWYHGNRRIQEVEWVFDDGTTVPQTLGDTTGLQTVEVDATTTTIVLRLVTVSPPGKGPSSRDYTAISDLSLISAG